MYARYTLGDNDIAENVRHHRTLSENPRNFGNLEIKKKHPN